jgi:hypothetical protein
MLNNKFKVILEELFYALTVSLAIFVILEIIKPRIILAYFNFNWLLLGWLVIGIIYLKINNKNN